MSSSDNRQDNYFRSTKQRPFHLSVGAVVFNQKGEFLSRHFSTFHDRPANIYLFPTETIEKYESIEIAVHRGLMEEVGVTANIEGLIGTSVGFAVSGDKVFEKTVIYFLMRLEEVKTPFFPDEDGASTIEWHTPEFLLEQAQYLPDDMIHSVLNESSIIKNAWKSLQTQAVHH